MFQTKKIEVKFKTRILYSVAFFFCQTFAVLKRWCGKKKYGTARQVTDDNIIWRKTDVICTPHNKGNNKDKHTIFNTSGLIIKSVWFRKTFCGNTEKQSNYATAYLCPYVLYSQIARLKKPISKGTYSLVSIQHVAHYFKVLTFGSCRQHTFAIIALPCNTHYFYTGQFGIQLNNRGYIAVLPLQQRLGACATILLHNIVRICHRLGAETCSSLYMCYIHFLNILFFTGRSC